MSVVTEPSPVHEIPTPERVRKRLAEVLREAQLLRQLLRVSESAAKESTCNKRNGGDSQ